jgi:hypothetical protein
MLEKRNSYRVLRKPEGKEPPGIPKCRWKCNIKFGLEEMGWL